MTMFIQLFIHRVLVLWTLSFRVVFVVCVKPSETEVYFSVRSGQQFNSDVPRKEGTNVSSHISCASLCLSMRTCMAYEFTSVSEDGGLCRVSDDFTEDQLEPGPSSVGEALQPPKDCPPPLDNVQGANVNYTSLSAGSTATFTCLPMATQISGENHITCMPDGQWTPSTIHCVPTGCYHYDGMRKRHWYTGDIMVTRSGITCQKWGHDTPHVRESAVVNDVNRQPSHLSDVDRNICRNYNNSTVPWCYTMDPSVEKEDCDIPSCNGA